jgi:hypothetical protein
MRLQAGQLRYCGSIPEREKVFFSSAKCLVIYVTTLETDEIKAFIMLELLQ